MIRPSELDPTTSLEACFGVTLRRLRVAAGLSQDDLAASIHFSSTLIQFVETARRASTWQFTKAIDPAVGADGMLIDLWQVLHKTGIAEWFRDFAELEARATTMSIYESQVVTGLLQTEAYAKAMIRADKPDYSDERYAQKVDVRLARQALLDADHLSNLWVILDEAALRRPVGGAPIMREQLEKLLQMAGRAKVVVQVLPFSAGVHAGLTGPFTLLDVPGEQPMAWAEARGSGRLVYETDEVSEAQHAFNRLRASALSEKDSFRLIASILEEYPDDPYGTERR